MKKIFLVLSACTLLVFSCESLAQAAVSSLVSNNTAPSISSESSSKSSSSATVDFKSGEVLCSSNNQEAIGSTFYVAQVITNASPQSKNQAEVLYVSDGSKEWVNYVIPSRKTVSDDLKIGAIIFYMPYCASYDTVELDTYRKTDWVLGRVTDVSDLFKNRIEIDGISCNINYLRIPTQAVKQ